jgi:four helix bundle protein
MKIEKFENIDSWKLGRELTNDIYEIFILSEKRDFGLQDQIQRASVSIIANIAEGFDSGTNKSFINFLRYSYRSASEVQSLLYIILDQKFITDEKFGLLYNKVVEIKKLIGGFIKYLQKQN